MKKILAVLFLSATVMTVGLTARAIAACYSEDLVGEKNVPVQKVERPVNLNSSKDAKIVQY